MTEDVQPILEIEDLNISIRSQYHFLEGMKAFVNEDKAKLERWGGMLRRNRFLRLEVHGHTDAVGPEGYNADLSARRATAAFEFLMDQGVAPDRMRTDAHGSLQPAASNASGEGRARNRRVELVKGK